MFRSFRRRDLFAGALVATPLARWLDTFIPAPEETRSSRGEATFELRKAPRSSRANVRARLRLGGTRIQSVEFDRWSGRILG